MMGVGYSSITSKPGPGPTGVVLLGVATCGWLLFTFGAERWSPAAPVGLGVLAVAGLGLTVVQSPGVGIVFPAVAALNAGKLLHPRWSIAGALAATLAFVLCELVTGHGPDWIIGGVSAILGGLMLGLIRRQNDALVEEAALAREEKARSSALDERNRLAREIHDVLAHSLAALTVQLETADALLEGGQTQRAKDSVVRAGRLAREGLAETRRAIGALRGEAVPLPELIEALAAGYRADFGVPVRVNVDGRPDELNPDIGLALYRSAQEAMTNVRKHAPGAVVDLTLSYKEKQVLLTVVNEPPPDGVDRPLARAGGGYGLTGLRERAELAGGTFEAGAAGPGELGWRVDVRIPA
jgi:signal transduction histidine kinase